LRAEGPFMRTRFGAVVVLSGSILCTAQVRAEGTWVAIPGRPDVPVIVNPFGYDSANTVVEGDFGLDRPAQVNAHTVGPLLVPIMMPRRYYFPHTGLEPGYGRLEVVPPPNRRLPPPAQSYHRSWGTSSDPLPASTDPPYPMSMDVNVNAWSRWGRHRRGDR
jgi:hypothetical protein